MFLPDMSALRPREVAAQSLYGNHILQVDPLDPQPKALYCVTADTHSIFNIIQKEYNRGSQKIIDALLKTHDVAIREIESPEEICEAIAAASRNVDLQTVVLHAHGSSGSISFPNKSLSNWDWSDLVFASDVHKLSGVVEECFKGLAPDAEITLLSCSTGKREDSIASSIARIANRTVWAPLAPVNLRVTEFSATAPARPLWETAYGTKDLACRFTPDGKRLCNPYEGSELIRHFFYHPLIYVPSVVIAILSTPLPPVIRSFTMAGTAAYLTGKTVSQVIRLSITLLGLTKSKIALIAQQIRWRHFS